MKIAVLVSGGVDSSVALSLLKEQGHDVTAFYLKIWLQDELSFLGECPWREDLEYVEKVCKDLDVPLKVVSLQNEYWDRIVNYTIDQIKSGYTPNPDVMCNQQIKFGAFFDKIDDSYEKVATGHYAHIRWEGETACLEMAPDAIKDQTYFLSQMSQQQLKRALFPLGALNKEQVRQLAQQLNLPTKDRKDSQGICFLGKFKFSEFVKHHVGEQEGDLVEVETGEKQGTHKGFWFYTVGQRQGLGLAGGPWYVVRKDTATNTVYISRNYYSADKKRDSFIIHSCNWLSGLRPEGDLKVKLRHGPHLHDCSVSWIDENRAQVQLKEHDQGIASGQFAVFYKGTTCLGSGVMDTTTLVESSALSQKN